MVVVLLLFLVLMMMLLPLMLLTALLLLLRASLLLLLVMLLVMVVLLLLLPIHLVKINLLVVVLLLNPPIQSMIQPQLVCRMIISLGRLLGSREGAQILGLAHDGNASIVRLLIGRPHAHSTIFGGRDAATITMGSGGSSSTSTRAAVLEDHGGG